MAKFFRKDRKNNLTEGRMIKYLKYAIGEIILVVIGILIALQLNIKNEERKARATERALLAGLIDDLRSDSTFYESRLLLFDDQIEFYNKLHEICSRQDTIPSDTVSLDITETGFVMAANFSDVVNNNSDLFPNISSDSIKQALRDYFKSFHFVSKAISITNERINEIGNDLNGRFGEIREVDDPVTMNDFRACCAADNLEGSVSILMNSCNNSRSQTLRFLTDNEELKQQLLNYLENFD